MDHPGELNYRGLFSENMVTRSTLRLFGRRKCKQSNVWALFNRSKLLVNRVTTVHCDYFINVLCSCEELRWSLSHSFLIGDSAGRSRWFTAATSK